MVYICKGECIHEDQSSHVGYYEGWRRCGNCGFNKETTDLYCYCCGQKYRTRPRDWERRQKALSIVKRI